MYERGKRYAILEHLGPMTAIDFHDSLRLGRSRRPRPLAAFRILTILFFIFAANAQQPAYDFIISGARIVDGTGAPWFYADIAFQGDRLASIGNLHDASAKQRL